jgi:hypothetical protein
MFKKVNIHEEKSLVSLKGKKKINRLAKHPILSQGKILGDITSPVLEEDWPSEFR